MLYKLVKKEVMNLRENGEVARKDLEEEREGIM